MCDHTTVQDNLSDYPVLKNLLPEDYSYHVCSFESLGNSGENFNTNLKLKLTREDEVQKWQEDFQASSGLTWRKSRTYPAAGNGSNKYRVNLRCHHNTRTTTAKSSKNTSCPAFMYAILKRQIFSKGRKSRSEDPHIKEGYYFNVVLKNTHNHRVSCAAALAKRDVSKETIEKLKKLFQSGHSPASALDTIKYDLQEQEGSSYYLAAADRSVCPDRDFCYHLYGKLFEGAYGAPAGEEMLGDLQKRIEIYNAEQGDVCAKMAKTEEHQLVIAICTPVMKRVHTTVRQSGEMLFIDSTGSCDRQNHRLFLLLTHSSAGGLPLGVLITTSENQPTITAALQLLSTILPRESFHGRQEKGPQVIMTDDCLALRNSLRSLYPDATCILCAFHLAQAMWRWLWSSHHGIPKHHRSHLMRGFQLLTYATTPSSLVEKYHALMEDPVAKEHPLFLKHLAEVYRRREEWAISLQSGLPTRGHHTNNYAESAMRVLKDAVLYRLKAYNVTQLVDFIHTRLEAHYIRRLTDVANDRVRREEPSPRAVDPKEIVQEDEMNYRVPSSTGPELYQVNMSIGYCSCPNGISGQRCKHQIAVERAFKRQDTFPHTSTTAMRRMYHQIATGGVDFPEDWFESLELPHTHGVPAGITCSGDTPSALEPLVMELPHSHGVLAGITCSGDTPSALDPLVMELPHSHGVPAGVTCTTTLEDELEGVFRSLTLKLRGDPGFTAPVRSFIASYNKMSTDSALQSALSLFGKSPVAKATGYQRPKGYLQTTAQIGVQPTAVARRKTPLGGRRALSSGRPAKASRQEHPYEKTGRKLSAPHSLAHCVETNSSLGGSH